MELECRACGEDSVRDLSLSLSLNLTEVRVVSRHLSPLGQRSEHGFPQEQVGWALQSVLTPQWVSRHFILT